MCRKDNIKEATYNLISAHGSTSAAATHLGIAPAHLHNAFTRISPPPTLEAALVKAGYIEPRPTRVRLAIDCERETRRRFRAEAAAQGMSGEAYLLELMEVFKNEFGY